jgi:hypothetical protein
MGICIRQHLPCMMISAIITRKTGHNQLKTLPIGLSRSIRQASDGRRAVVTHGETEGCEGSLETEFYAARNEGMDAEFQAVRCAPKQANVLQARSLGASWLILLQSRVSADIEIATGRRDWSGTLKSYRPVGETGTACS